MPSRAVFPHLLTVTGDGERIIPIAITERLVMGADGELEPVTPVRAGRSRRSCTMPASAR
jgi:hypothetical protein